MKSKFLPAFILILLAGHLAFAAGPTITSFSPAAGRVGTLVTITGTNLSSPTAFTIGGVTAVVVSDNGTQLVGMVMPGAITGAVSVTTSGGTASGAGNFTVNPPTYPTAQQAILSGTQATYYSEQGSSLALSADGNTAIVGAPNDNGGIGSSYVFTRSGGPWTQQAKLVGTGEYINYGMQGNAVALSADGNTAMVGGYSDGSTFVGTSGFVWFFTRTGTTWTQQGSKLSGTGAIFAVNNGVVFQGFSVALSADGNTAIESGPEDNGGIGATWIFTRSSAGVWSQLGSKMVIPGAATAQGHSVAMSADASTIVVGCSGGAGGAYVYTRSGNTWVLQGGELTVAGSVGLGAAVALSADGNTALLGAPGSAGAWAFTRTGGTWSQFGSEFTFPGALNVNNGAGTAVSLSADGNTAVIGTPGNGNQYPEGGTYIYTRSSTDFVNQGGLILGQNNTSADAAQGTAVAINATGTTALSGGPNDNNYTGYVFQLGAVVPAAATNAATNITSSSANINGYVTTSGAGLSANAQFEWGTDPNLVGATVTTTFSLGTNPISPNTTNASFSSFINGLTPQTTYYFRIDGTNINGTGYGVIKSFTTAIAPPISLTGGTATGTISACVGEPSASPLIEQISVTAVSLTTGVSVTAPTGFQVSANATTGYSGNIILTATGGAVNQVVYVRSAAGGAAGPISGNVVLSSTGVPNVNVAVTGMVNALPTVNTVANQTVSGNTATAAVNFTGTANTFNWTNDTPSIGLAASGSGNIPSFIATNTGSSPVKATVAVNPVSAGFAYITNTITTGANISPVNALTDVVATPVAAGNSPFGVAISPDGSKAYITNSAGAAVSVVSTATNQVTNTINLTANPYGIAVSPDGTKLYTANYGQNNISVVNAATNMVTATFTSELSPFGIVVSKDGSTIYVACSGANIIEGFNTATNAITAIIPVGTTPQGLAMSADGTTMYVANYRSNTVSVINVQMQTVVATINAGTGPYGITASPDGSKVYVSNNTSNNLSVINTATNAVTATIPVGQAPRGVSTSPDGTLLYVANYSSGTMSVINTVTNQVVNTVNVGSNPTSFGNFVTGNGCSGPPITFTITVDPKALPAAVITFNQPANQVYGSADLAPGATSTNTVTPITYNSSNTAVATIVNGDIHIIGVGSTQITASQAASSTYGAAVPVIQTFTVTPAPLTITADNQTKVAGAANPVFTATYTTFVNGDTEASLTTPPTITSTATTGSPVGSYPITASGAVDANYDITYVTGTLSVVSKPTAITLAATSLNPTGATLNGTVNDNGATTTVQMAYSTAPDMSGAIDVTLTTGTSPIAAGTGNTSFSSVVTTLTPQTTYYFQISGKNNYGTTNGNIVSFITPAVPLLTESITFNPPPNKVYGSADVNPGATSTNTTIPITYTSSNTAVATIVNGQIHIVGIGSTQITASQAGNGTYSPATPVVHNFTVTPALLTVMPAHQTKVYGTANPTLTVNYKGFVNGDNAASLTTPATASTTATTSSGVGNYQITASGAVDPNYTFNYVPDTLTVTPAALLITVNNQSKIYGAAIPAFTVVYTSFVNGDGPANLAIQPTITTTATASSPVGTYPITATGAVDANYTITYKAGSLSITTAALTITAVNETKTYGAANPYLAVSYTGFIAGDDSTKLTTQPKVTTTATVSSVVGSYPITVSGAVDNNYTISYVAGTLKVTPARLNIAANDQTKVFGTANPTLTISYNGFENGDAAANLTTKPVISTTATQSSQVGTYPITVSGAADINYSITYTNGTLTVTPVLVLSPFPPKTYGDPDFDPNATGNNITYTSGNTGVATIVNGEIHIVGAGSVVITATSGGTSVQQTLVINKAPLLITANNQKRPYGTTNPMLTVSYDKFVYTDDSTSLTTQPIVTTTATTTSDVGSYPISVSGATAANYAITYENGTLSIAKATQTITFAPIPDQVEPSVYDLSGVIASSGLTVSFTLSNGSLASINGTDLTSTLPGTETVTASQPGNNDYEAATAQSQTYQIKEPDNGDVLVAMVVSPNGDGINDVLNVSNIQFYPDNKLILINRNGVKIYEAKGYNNTSVVFDGHSSVTGVLQQQGTYLYVLEYRVNGELKRKAGFTILRY